VIGGKAKDRLTLPYFPGANMAAEKLAPPAAMTVPALLALASGKTCAGPHRCFYCGAACNIKWPAATYVKDSFTGRNGVVAPGSPWVCQGCVLCLRESCTIAMLAGKKRHEQKMRGYSWVVTSHGAKAATKADIRELRAICVSPPDPPWAIILSDSGQTHQLYRGRVNHSCSEVVTLTLEAEAITYRTDQLVAALAVAGRICAACGKPSLSEPITGNRAIAVMERYAGGESLLATWSSLWSTGLGRLAAWLTPKKEVAQIEYQEDARQER
jgi:CRISPR type IV-associated protein Csf1